MEGAIREVNAFSTFAFDILKEIYRFRGLVDNSRLSLLNVNPVNCVRKGVFYIFKVYHEGTIWIITCIKTCRR